MLPSDGSSVTYSTPTVNTLLGFFSSCFRTGAVPASVVVEKIPVGGNGTFVVGLTKKASANVMAQNAAAAADNFHSRRVIWALRELMIGIVSVSLLLRFQQF